MKHKILRQLFIALPYTIGYLLQWPITTYQEMQINILGKKKRDANKSFALTSSSNCRKRAAQYEHTTKSK